MKLSYLKLFLTVTGQEEWLNDMSRNGLHLIKRRFLILYIFEYEPETCYRYGLEFLNNFGFRFKDKKLVRVLSEQGWSIVSFIWYWRIHDIIRRPNKSGSCVRGLDEYDRYRRLLYVQIFTIIIPILAAFLVIIGLISGYLYNPPDASYTIVDLTTFLGLIGFISFLIIVKIANIVLLRCQISDINDSG